MITKTIIAVNGDNADSELFAKVVELYQTDEVAEKLAEASNGGDVPAWTEEGEEESDSSESEETTEESEESEESAE